MSTALKFDSYPEINMKTEEEKLGKLESRKGRPMGGGAARGGEGAGEEVIKPISGAKEDDVPANG